MSRVMLSSQRLCPKLCSNCVALIIVLAFASFLDMLGIVPKLNRWPGQIIFIAKGTEARGLQHEKSPGTGFQSEPAGGEYSQKVAARENKHVTCDSAHPVDCAISACAHLVWRFTIGAAVAKQLPIR